MPESRKSMRADPPYANGFSAVLIFGGATNGAKTREMAEGRSPDQRPRPGEKPRRKRLG